MQPKQPKVIVIDPKDGSRKFYTEEEVPSVEALEKLAGVMDSLFAIPGTKLKVGLDSILGLIPALGDTATSLVSLYILHSANQLGVSRLTMTRMAANVAVDYVIGTVPLLGDVVDVYWKANQRNVALLRKHIAASPEMRRKQRVSDGAFFAMLVAVLLLVLIGSMTVAFFVVSWIWSLLFTSRS